MFSNPCGMSKGDLRFRNQNYEGGRHAFVVNEQKSYSLTRSEQRFYDLNGKVLGGRDNIVLALKIDEEMSDCRDTNSHCDNINQLSMKGLPIRYETNLGHGNDFVDNDYGMEVEVQTMNNEEEEVNSPEVVSRNIFPMSGSLDDDELDLRVLFSDSSFLTTDDEEIENANVSDNNVIKASEMEHERLARESVASHNYCLQEKAEDKTIDIEPKGDNVVKNGFEPCNNESLSVEVIPLKRKRGRPRKIRPNIDGNTTCVNAMSNKPTQSKLAKKRQIVKKPLKKRAPKKMRGNANGFVKGYELEQIVGVTRNEKTGEWLLYVKFKNVNEEEELPSKVIAKYAPRMLIDYYHRHMTWNE